MNRTICLRPGFVLLATSFVLSAILAGPAAAENTVSVADYGARPGSGEDTCAAVAKAVDACRGKEGTVLFFPPGRYDFHPENAVQREYYMSNTEPVNPKRIGLFLEDIRKLRVSGAGAQFVFHDRMTPMILDRCEDVTLEGFSIDWDIPVLAQGTLVKIEDDSFDLRIDTAQFPYAIEDDRLVFTGEGWRGTIFGHILFDGNTREIRYQTLENPLGSKAFEKRTEEIAPGLVRVHARVGRLAQAGDIVALRHTQRRDTTGIFIYQSRNTVLRDLRMRHAVGTGILGQRSENITLDHVYVQPNEARGRVGSTYADATHFSGCRGLVRMEQCDFTGMMDDWTNVHGTTTPIVQVTAPDTVVAEYKHQESQDLLLYGPGDEATFIDLATAQRGPTRTVKSFRILSPARFELVFTEALPQGVVAGTVLENMTWTPEVEIRNCTIQRRHRARGILMTTPRRVVIEDNMFRTAGAALLIEGDAQYWYESGAVTDVLIRRNTFEDCLSSRGWGEAPITITPSHKPQDESAEPYHRNIRIEDNTFKVFDYRILYARSVRGLVFSGNRIERSNTYKAFSPAASFTFDGCRDVQIKGNTLEGPVLGADVKTMHMKSGDLAVEPGQGIAQ